MKYEYEFHEQKIPANGLFHGEKITVRNRILYNIFARNPIFNWKYRFQKSEAILLANDYQH